MSHRQENCIKRVNVAPPANGKGETEQETFGERNEQKGDFAQLKWIGEGKSEFPFKTIAQVLYAKVQCRERTQKK